METRWLVRELDTPLGRLKLLATDQAIKALLWEHEREGRVRLPGVSPAPARHALLDEASRQLTAYLEGRLFRFELPLEPEGTPFQKQAWLALREIPYGETRSYAELARAVHAPGSARAVGAANGRNPLSIVVPCHRVIGASGALTGFAGGLDAKRWLLTHEARAKGKGSACAPPISRVC